MSNRRDLDALMSRIKHLDVVSKVMQDRESTKWKPVMLTNVVFYISFTNFLLGAAVKLPRFIKRKKCIIGCDIDPKSKKPYRDNLCFFRCLSNYQNADDIEKRTHELAERWSEYRDGPPTVLLGDISDLEHCFGININVFELQEDERAKIVYTSCLRHDRRDKILNLNLYKNHLNFIQNLQAYAHKYRCGQCDKLFKTSYKLHRHRKTCGKQSTVVYPGRYFKIPQTIFDDLCENALIAVPQALQFYPWFACFDLEAMLVPINEKSDSTEWTARHRAISFSCCSNVPGYTQPKFFASDDLDELTSELVDALLEIQEKAYELAKARWRDVIVQLRECIENAEDDQETKTQYEMLLGRLHGYLKELPCCGFNSSR